MHKTAKPTSAGARIMARRPIARPVECADNVSALVETESRALRLPAVVEGSETDRHGEHGVTLGAIDDASIFARRLRVGVPEHVLHGAQIPRVVVGESGRGVPQGVIRDSGPFQVGGSRVGVNDLPDSPAGEPMTTGAVAEDGKQRGAVLVEDRRASVGEIGVERRGDVGPEVDDPIMPLAPNAHHLSFAFLLHAQGVRAGDLDGPQAVEGEESEHGAIAPRLLGGAAVELAQEQEELAFTQVAEVVGAAPIPRWPNVHGGVVLAESRGNRGGVEASNDGELVADAGGLVVVVDERGAVGFHVGGRGAGRIDRASPTEGKPARNLGAVAADRVVAGVSVGHVEAEEAGEGGVQVGCLGG